MLFSFHWTKAFSDGAYGEAFGDRRRFVPLLIGKPAIGIRT